MRIAALVMQRNELELLPCWLAYYGQLCGGYDNLFVFDDRSDSHHLRPILQEAAEKGVHVFYNDGSWSHASKGELFDALIREKRHLYDWFLPVDCDEFLCCSKQEAPIAVLDAIREELQRIDKPAGRVRASFENIPHSTCVFRSLAMKVVIRATENPVSVGGYGLHAYDYAIGRDTCAPDEICETNLATIHFHNRPLHQAVSNGIVKLRDRMSKITPRSLELYSGDGRHLKEIFRVNEHEYIRKFEDKERIDISATFSALGMPVPFSAPVAFSALSHIPWFLVELIVASPREREALCKLISQCTRYFEYGCGGTTKVACEVGIEKVVSIEPDSEYARYVLEEYQLQPFVDDGRLNLIHADLGKTGSCERPIQPPSLAATERYLELAELAASCDLVLVNGRFRVACAASLYLHCLDSCTIAIRDYANRPHYGIVEEFLDKVEEVENLAIFRRRSGKEAQARTIMRDFIEISD